MSEPHPRPLSSKAVEGCLKNNIISLDINTYIINSLFTVSGFFKSPCNKMKRFDAVPFIT
jgi:hypothetical protein